MFKQLTRMSCFPLGSSGRLTSIHSGYGSLMAASSDGTIAILHPDRTLARIALLKVPVPSYWYLTAPVMIF